MIPKYLVLTFNNTKQYIFASYEGLNGVPAFTVIG